MDVFAHKFYYYVYDSNATSLFCFHVLKIQMCMRNSIPRGSINQYTYENGIQFEIKFFQSSRLSSFTVPEDTRIISPIVDQNFTMKEWSWIHCDSSTNKKKMICLENNNINNIMMKISPDLPLTGSLP